MIFSDAVLLFVAVQVILGTAWAYPKVFRVHPISGNQPQISRGNSIYVGNSTVVNSHPEYINNDYGNAGGEWFDLSK